MLARTPPQARAASRCSSSADFIGAKRVESSVARGGDAARSHAGHRGAHRGQRALATAAWRRLYRAICISMAS